MEMRIGDIETTPLWDRMPRWTRCLLATLAWFVFVVILLAPLRLWLF